MHTAIPVPAPSAARNHDRSFGILSSFPPTSCGIATFSAALAAGLVVDGASVNVVRCEPSPEIEDVLVVASLADGPPSNASSSWNPIEALNANDVVIVQHEYGLYDGSDGEALIELVDALEVPVVLVAHTVLTDPTPNQRRVLERVCAAAAAVVVMTETARARLIAGFDVDHARVVVIPHGAATPAAGPLSADRAMHDPPMLLTWGLLGPGKGIEWAIDAFAELDDLDTMPEYVIAGATHPKIREAHGETYREMLVERAANSPAAACISFDDTYRDLASLHDLIQSADVVVLPYDSREQVTSGCLGRCGGSGPTGRVDGIPPCRRAAVERCWSRGAAGGSGGAQSCDPSGADRAWTGRIDGGRGSTSGARVGLAGRGPPILAAGRADRGRTPVDHRRTAIGCMVMAPSFDHVLSMTDDIGMFEHADHAQPRHEHGYCTDDVARLLIVVAREPDASQELRELGRTAFRFMSASQSATGRTRNRRAADGRWQSRYVVDDCWGRSLWAFGTAARRAPEAWMRSSATSYFNHGVKQRSPHRRAMAFAALGAAEIADHDPRHFHARALLADAVTTIGPLSPEAGWPWPEPRLSYANAALPEALIAAGDVLQRPDVLDDGLTLLGWLLDHETIDGHLSPTPVGGAGPADEHAAFRPAADRGRSDWPTHVLAPTW